MKKKKIGNILFLLFVFLFTIYSIFHGEDLHAILKEIIKANPWYIIFGVLGVLFFIWGESIILYYLFNTVNIKTKRRICFQYSCIGFFFSCITPSASGGQPAQMYYMHKNKIPISISALVLMIVTIAYKAVLVFIGLFVAFFQKGFVNHYLTKIVPVFYLGVLLNVICCAGMSVLVLNPALAEKIIKKCLSFFEKLRLIKNNPEREKKIEDSMEQYHIAAKYLKNHKKVMINVFLITFVQRFALFLVTWFVYKAFGLCGANIYDVVILQAIVAISVDMLPVPGGMGVSESLFLIIFKGIFTGGLLLPGMILSRGIAYYVQLIFSAMMTAIAHFTINYQSAD